MLMTVKIISTEPLTTPVDQRTVIPTGTEPLYDPNGKVIANTTTMKLLAKSRLGQHNFIAHQRAKAETGEVYYQIESFDHSYNGWVFGGKDSNSFGGGNPISNYHGNSYYHGAR